MLSVSDAKISFSEDALNDSAALKQLVKVPPRKRRLEMAHKTSHHQPPQRKIIAS